MAVAPPAGIPAGIPAGLIVTGPTASGKSALALALARRYAGTVINADAMQLYRDLHILTARPSAADAAAVPHVLYGVRPVTPPATAAWWRDAALAEMHAAHAAGRVPILCGGSGMYLTALVNGLAPIPDPGPAARAEARALLAALGPAALHARLAEADPATAATLRPSDSQRLARAWEVWRGTGRGLVAWHAAPAVPPAWRFAAIRLDPPRAELRDAAAARFHAMLADGALEEVRALLGRGFPPDAPLLRAHGVPELGAHLRGATSLDAAAAAAIAATLRYVKRQVTWFRHHNLAPEADTHMIHARFTGQTQFSESFLSQIDRFLRPSA